MYNTYPDVVTVKQLCEMLHVGRNTAYALLKSGEIKTVRIGRRYLIPKSCIIHYVHQKLSVSSLKDCNL